MATKQPAAKRAAKNTRTPLVGADPRAETTGNVAAESAEHEPQPTGVTGGSTVTPEATVMPRRRAKLANLELVKVQVPKAFNLTLDDGSMVRYEVGTETMPRDHAEHWYAAAHDVEIL